MVGGHLVIQPGLDRFPLRGVRGQGLFITLAPTANLPRDIAFGLAQLAQATSVVIDAVQFDQALDKALAQRLGLGGIEAKLRWQVGAQDNALDPLHHIELRADQAFVAAMRIGLRAIREAVLEPIEDAEFAPHVVS